MNARTVAIGIGTAVTTFLVAGAATIALLGAGEAPGIGILGVFAGVVAGTAAGVVVAVYADRLPAVARSALVFYATFGVALLAVAGLQYVNVPGADELFTTPVHVGVSVLAAALVTLFAGRRRGHDRPAGA